MDTLPRAIALLCSRFFYRFALAAFLAALLPAEAGRAEVSTMRVVGSGEATSRNASDRILLVSTRSLGTRCDAAAMAGGLRCERRGGDGRWESLSWNDVLTDFAAEPLPTVIYVHGNRVENGADKPHGLEFYRWLSARRPVGTPMRYVIWSWQSSQVRGRIKDYEVKAARCQPCGWQLAWAIDQLPSESPLAVVGYSYGARLTTAALHVLGGGQIGSLGLSERVHPDRPPVRAALVAAAVDANWLRPGGRHDHALRQVDHLLLVNNQRDPAMRFYPISPVGRHASALGYAGVPGRDSLGDVASRIHSIDMTEAVGRHHALGEYLGASSMLARAMVRVVDVPAATGTPNVDASSLAERDASGGLQ